MRNESSYPHQGFYYAHQESATEYRREPSGRIHAERLINGAAGFIHNAQQKEWQPRILVVNDWRVFSFHQKDNSFKMDQIHQALHNLISRENKPFTVYLQSHEKFTPFTSDMSFVEFCELADHFERFFFDGIESNAVIMQKFKLFNNKNNPKHPINEEHLFVIDQFEMDALIRQSSIVEYSVALEDLANIASNPLCSDLHEYLKKIVHRASYVTSNSILAISHNNQLNFYSSYATEPNCKPISKSSLSSILTKELEIYDMATCIKFIPDDKPIKLSTPYDCTVYKISDARMDRFKQEHPSTTAIDSKDIQQLSLFIYDPNTNLEDLYFLPNLESLYLNIGQNSCETITEDFINELIQHQSFPKLSHLILKITSPLPTGSISIAKTYLERSPLIRYLEIFSHYRNQNVENVSQFSWPNLKNFKLCMEEHKVNVLQLLANMPNLESLLLFSTSIEAKDYQIGLPILPYLRNLELHNATLKDARFLHSLLDSSTQLKFLNCTNENSQHETTISLKDYGLHEIYNRDLHILKLSDYSFSESDIYSLMRQLPDLNQLILQQCSIQFDSLTCTLMDGLPSKNIHYLELTDCASFLAYLPVILSHTPKLRDLFIVDMLDEDMTWPNDMSMQIKKMCDLKNLTIDYATSINRSEIKDRIEKGTFEELFRPSTFSFYGDTANIDAVFDDDDIEFNITRHFFHKSGQHPSVSTYRDKVYDTLVINPEVCDQINAFALKYQSDDLNLVSADWIERLDNVIESVPDDNEENQYFVGRKIYHASSDWQALPSLFFHEKILSCSKLYDHDIEIKYSLRDNLYYLKFEENNLSNQINFEFIIETPRKNPEFILDEEFKKTISSITEKIAGYENFALSLNEDDNYTGLDYLNEIIEQKRGACRHRAVVFKYLIDAYLADVYVNENEPCIVKYVLNQCHVFCEIVFKNSPRNFLSIDLGGAPGMLYEYDELNPFETNNTSKAKSSTFLSQSLGSLEQLDQGLLNEIQDDFLKELKTLTIDETLKLKIHESFEKLTTDTPVLLASAIQTVISSKDEKILLKTNQAKQSFDVILSLIEKLENEGHDYFIAYQPETLLTPSAYIKSKPDSDIGEICYETGGQLYEFLMKARQNSDVGYLIILYDTFNPKDIIQLNKIIDEEGRCVDKIALNNFIKVVGIYNTSTSNAYLGQDFTSRFDLKIPIAPQECTIDNLTIEPPFQTSLSVIRIDFYHDPMWQNYLYGHWQMQADALHFIKSEFIETLIKTPHAIFEFYNCPADLELYHSINKARALGTICINRTKIFFPTDINIQFKEGYQYQNFFHLIQLRYKEEINPQIMILLNNETLDDFLGTYIIEENQHSIQIKPGLLENNQNSSMEVFINAKLQEDVFYKFLKKMVTYRVSITFNYNSHQYFPSDFFEGYAEHNLAIDENDTDDFLDIFANEVDNIEIERPTKRTKISHPTLLYDNNIIIIDGEDIDVCQYIYQKHLRFFEPDKTLIIDISEITSEELFFMLDAKPNPKKRKFEFSVIDGLLQKEEYKTKHFILKGYFNKEITNKLSKFLLARLNLTSSDTRRFALIPSNPQAFAFFPSANKVCLKDFSIDLSSLKKQMLQNALGADLENIPCFSNEDFISNYSFAQLQACMYYIKINMANSPWQGTITIEQRNTLNTSIDFHNSARITEQFYSNRLKNVAAILQTDATAFIPQSSYVFLTGLTGVGKTHFIHHVWQKHHPHCHYGLEHLKEFCLDERPGIKTLIIDEANLVQQNFSIFQGLFEAKPHIRVNNHVYFITPYHKVIFIGNPLSYSQDRKLSQLCVQHGNACLFDEIPPEVIYHEILNPLFSYLNLADKDHEPLAELFLTRQHFINSQANQITISPRELTAMALLTLQNDANKKSINALLTAGLDAVNTIIKHSVPTSIYKNYLNTFSIQEASTPDNTNITMEDGFLLTPSRKMLQQTILDFLTLRQSRQETFFSQSQNLNANFNDTFIYDGLNGLLIEGEPGIGKSQLVMKTLKANLGTSKIYHISASSTPEEKQTQLRAAFYHGDIAVVDEINCACLDERFLNAILSGIDPITHQRPMTPGFLLIGTMNPATMSGRQSFGEALSRRFLKIILEPYSQNEMVDILTHKGLDEQGAQYMVSLYLYKKINATLKFNPALCFRDLIHVANACLPTTTFGYKAHAKSGMCFYSLPDEEEKQTQEAVLKVTF